MRRKLSDKLNRKAFQVFENKDTLKTAEDFEELEQSKGYQRQQMLIRHRYDLRVRELDAVRDMDINQIVKMGETAYLVERTRLETEVATLKAVLSIVDECKERAGQILAGEASRINAKR